ncbi:hypothetical protein ACJX0J_019259, partial [Zea mays]
MTFHAALKDSCVDDDDARELLYRELYMREGGYDVGLYHNYLCRVHTIPCVEDDDARTAARGAIHLRFFTERAATQHYMGHLILLEFMLIMAELAKSSSDPETLLLEALRSTAYSGKFILVIYLFYNECGKIDRLM